MLNSKFEKQRNMNLSTKVWRRNTINTKLAKATLAKITLVTLKFETAKELRSCAGASASFAFLFLNAFGSKSFATFA